MMTVPCVMQHSRLDDGNPCKHTVCTMSMTPEGLVCRHEDLCVPSLMQVLSWSQAVIDTHAALPGPMLRSKPDLQGLTKRLSAATAVCKEVAMLTGMIAQLRSLSADVASKRQDGSWTIDVLDLHVKKRV